MKEKINIRAQADMKVSEHFKTLKLLSILQTSGNWSD